MALTENALLDAKEYARFCRDERGREYARICTVRMLVNGYPQGHGKSEEFYGYAVETQSATGDESLVIFHQDEIPDAAHSAYLIDDGTTVTGWYVAGWNVSGRQVYLQRFPTNVDSEGNVRIRPDNGRPVDYSDMLFPPRRAYHVKLTRD